MLPPVFGCKGIACFFAVGALVLAGRAVAAPEGVSLEAGSAETAVEAVLTRPLVATQDNPAQITVKAPPCGANACAWEMRLQEVVFDRAAIGLRIHVRPPAQVSVRPGSVRPYPAVSGWDVGPVFRGEYGDGRGSRSRAFALPVPDPATRSGEIVVTFTPVFRENASRSERVTVGKVVLVSVPVGSHGEGAKKPE